MSRILVIGGTGLIGSKVVPILQSKGKQVVIGSPSKGVNSVTGQGLAEALKGVDTIVDVANAPGEIFFNKPAIHEFFEKSTSNIVQEAKKLGSVKHYVALSIIGVDKMPDVPYMSAKVAQENIIKASGIPYTIVRAAQFYDFLGGLADASTKGQEVFVTNKYVQLIAAEDVAEAVATNSLGNPANGFVNVAGPEKFRLDAIIARFLSDIKDPRKVVGDANTSYFGAPLVDEYTLTLNAGNSDGVTYKIGYPSWFAASKYSKKA